MGGQPRVTSLRKRGRPTADERRARETEILTAALDVFLRTGYGACTVDELAVAAQVTKRTLYAYFGDKADVFAAMVKDLAAEVSLDAATDIDTLETLAAPLFSLLLGEKHRRRLLGIDPAPTPAQAAAHADTALALLGLARRVVG
ncbi:MAG: TetR/AcrR family transcriptional regulator [Trebonia sp.]